MKKVICLVCVVLAGCQQSVPVVDHDGLIRKNGGYAVLKIDAGSMLASADQSGIVDPTNYTALVRALMPQRVAVHRREPPVLMIQTMGGFNHQGVLVVVGTNSFAPPEVGHGWVRKELAPGVFEFRE